MQRNRRFTQFIHSKITSRRTVNRWVVWVIGFGVLLCVGIGAVFLSSSQSVIERKVVAQAVFPVYAPGSAPDGYDILPAQTKLSPTMLTYGFKERGSDELLAVTVQSRPKSFDVTQMTKGGSVSSTAVDSGTLYDLSVGGSSQYLLDTGDALVYITSATKVSTAMINSFASSLEKRN